MTVVGINFLVLVLIATVDFLVQNVSVM